MNKEGWKGEINNINNEKILSRDWEERIGGDNENEGK
jgi:hypothetical protein